MMTFIPSVKCAETNEENTETESVYSLQCRMSQDVQHLDDGIKFVSRVFFFILTLTCSVLDYVCTRMVWFPK